MVDRGRHDRHTQGHQEARYRLRKGMAKVALSEKLTGKPAVDSHGQPLRAHEMAQRHSLAQLERWARGSRLVGVSLSVESTHPKAARWPA